MAETSICDRLVLAMVSGLDPARAAERLCTDPVEAKKLVAEARRRLTLAAEYHRDEQLGTAIARLNDLYAKISADKDLSTEKRAKTCIQIQKELNRLLDLYRPTERQGGGDDTGEAASELAAVREHLLPLALAPLDSSTEELARLAVSEILSLKHLAPQ